MQVNRSQAETPDRSNLDCAELSIQQLTLHYAQTEALSSISFDVFPGSVTALIGPSGCGKSSLLRCMNRMNDLIETARISGTVSLRGVDIYGPQIDVTRLRQRVGMVFQKSNPFPISIYENVSFGLKIKSRLRRTELDEAVERSLKSVGLWNEVADRLSLSALALSVGQQQRLCIARAIATEPDVLLMDEPCAGLDPVATARVEELIGELKQSYTIVMVTHNMQQAGRIADFTGFMLQGQLIEFDRTAKLFQRPKDERTDGYLRGRFA